MRQHKGWCLPDFDQHFGAFLDTYPGTHYQQQALELALAHCDRRELAVDIGANIGLHAVRLAQHFQQVLCFEPTTAVYDCLRANASRFTNVHVFKLGLGDRAHCSQISAPADTTNCGVYSMVDFDQHQAAVQQEQIAVMPLDAFEVEPDLVKIDTQGYEPWILRGCRETLLRRHPVLLIEVEGPMVRSEIHQILRPMGYEPVAAVRHDQVWVKTGEPTAACVASNVHSQDHLGSSGTGPVSLPMPLDPEDWDFQSR